MPAAGKIDSTAVSPESVLPLSVEPVSVVSSVASPLAQPARRARMKIERMESSAVGLV
jgi:hypothetical protein